MIYLIDNQLPIGLVGHLQAHGLNVVHVSDCKLEKASDQEIWNYAKTSDCVIVSKDEDFLHLSGNDSSGPPFVWVRFGNCRNSVLFRAFDRILPHLLETINSGAKVIEIWE
jgi:predicted nuclease of predicted toxin-antitoxin system